MTTAVFLVPEGIHDPARPSGGNRYDRQVIQGVAHEGVRIHVVEIPLTGQPSPDPRTAVSHSLRSLPHNTVVVVDGLLAGHVAEPLLESADRLRLVPLVHMPQGGRAERDVVHAATAVITTSAWTKRWVSDSCRVPADRVHVVEPGVEPAPLTSPTRSGGRLLCVAAVLPHKGQDVLVSALDRMGRADWRCAFAGDRTIDPAFAAQVEQQAEAAGLTALVEFRGPLGDADLGRAYLAADLLVLPSRIETYGMVIPEALAHGIPVVASDTGGVREALGVDPHGGRPGILVAPDDANALARALTSWLDDEVLRSRLRQSARRRRETLRTWADMHRGIRDVLLEAAA